MLEGVKLGLRSAVLSLRHPWLLVILWVAVTLPAALIVLPLHEALASELMHHPGASLRVDQFLDADFARRHPEAALSLLAGSVALFLLWTLLAGGIVATTGAGERFTLTAMLREGAAQWTRVVRVLALGLLLALLIGWGESWARHRLTQALAGVDAGPLSFARSITWLWWLNWQFVVEVLRWLSGFVFVLLVLLAKTAIATLVVERRSSALAAWLVAGLVALRAPLRFASTAAVLLLLWLGGSHLLGSLQVRLLELGEQLLAGALVGQAQVLWVQAVLVAFFVAARELVHRARPAPVTERSPEELLPT
jgi:hypothetical protein